MNEVKVLYERSLMPLWLYRQVRSDEIDYSVEEEEPELEEFINLVGEEAAKSLVLFRGS